MSPPDAQHSPLPGELGEVSNALLLAPSLETVDGEGCARICSASSLARSNLLLVSLTTPPDERLAAFRSQVGDVDPPRIGFVTAGDAARSVSAAAPDADLGFDDRSVTYKSVSTPADLTGLGIELSSLLSEWQEHGDPTVMCFHSLSTLLQYTETRQVFRFLHVLTGRIDSVDAFAHYHLDPGAHDVQDVNTLKPLFDAVVSYEDDEWSVVTR